LKNLKKEAGFKDGVLFGGQSKDKIVKYCKAVRTNRMSSQITLTYGRQENRLFTFVASRAIGLQPRTSTDHSPIGVGI
jgi:hypothetical protein